MQKFPNVHSSFLHAEITPSSSPSQPSHSTPNSASKLPRRSLRLEHLPTCLSSPGGRVKLSNPASTPSVPILHTQRLVPSSYHAWPRPCSYLPAVVQAALLQTPHLSDMPGLPSSRDSTNRSLRTRHRAMHSSSSRKVWQETHDGSYLLPHTAPYSTGFWPGLHAKAWP